MSKPFLIQAGFIQRTPRGRVATVLAYEHFGRQPGAAKPVTGKGQPDLFE